jgi:dipeptidyl-peptidase-4
VTGAREYHAAVIRPTNFKPGTKYPVLVSVYGGPHSNTVMASQRAYLLQQWYADHGFIVVSIDGRGTPNRGRAWERAIKGNLIDIPLEDQVDGLKALGAKYAEMDMSRIGIYGWSFGGYFSAMAAMRRPDVYHAGVAGAPVCDWRDYDTAYTERYLDLPQTNEKGYDASSVLTYCDKLERPLLIIHGTADDNVYFLHSLKMTQKLFRAGRDFEFLPLAGFTHMVPEPVVTTRLYSRIADFMVQNVANKPAAAPQVRYDARSTLSDRISFRVVVRMSCRCGDHHRLCPPSPCR